MVKQKPTIIYENTVVGVFVRRINRFTAEVLIDGEPETVHVKNTGRLQELLLKWVNIDSLAPNMLMKQQLMSLNYDLVKPEYTYGKSRIDFYMESNGERFLTEVKGCTLADDLHPGIGLFPDAPTERGTKHLRELIKAVSEGYNCYIAFVIPMEGVKMVYPNAAMDKEFAEAFYEAQAAGVKVLNLACRVEKDELEVL